MDQCSLDLANFGSSVAHGVTAEHFDAQVTNLKANALLFLLCGCVCAPTLHLLTRNVVAPRLFTERFDALKEEQKVRGDGGVTCSTCSRLHVPYEHLLPTRARSHTTTDRR